MGINIAICENETKTAKCVSLKNQISRVYLDNIEPFKSVADYDEIVSLDDAKNLFPDYDDFLKRNKINDDADAIYMFKIKNDADRARLETKIFKNYTGWIICDNLSEEEKTKAINSSKPENRITGWDNLSFDEMGEMCASCPLSWDKGRGCIGAFGPDNSLLPEIAKKNGCEIISSAVESSKSQKRFSPEDAKKLLNEVSILNEKLPDEGKVMVRRYSGPLERLELVANLCIKENCGFYFF